mgnify:CR=1 FL=1
MSDEVKRYDVTDVRDKHDGEYYGEMRERKDGQYVKFSDYEALRKRLGVLQDAINTIENDDGCIPEWHWQKILELKTNGGDDE